MSRTALPSTTTIIRPSSLTSWGDCPRRAAASLFKREIRDAGFDLNDSLNSIAAGVGTATHAGAAVILMEKMGDASLPSGALTAGVDAAIDSLVAQVRDGVVWDDTTPTKTIAERQIKRMTRAYFQYLAPIIEPIAVEERLEADAGDGFVVSGQSDAIAREPDAVRDLKTGVASRTHAPQLGAYAMLQASHGRIVKSGKTDFIKRVHPDKDQPPPVTTEYPLDDIVQVARHRIERIKRELTEFRRRLDDGDAAPEWSFDVNPMSMMCTAKFCSAYGTSFCNEWRYKEK